VTDLLRLRDGAGVQMFGLVWSPIDRGRASRYCYGPNRVVEDALSSNMAGPEDRNRNFRTLELTSREVKLLLKYGYPFPEQE
jgi:hypothetical protein